MDGEKLKYGFLNNHHVLVARLSTISILPHLLSESLITFTEKGVIEHEVTDGQKTDKLMDIIHRQGITNPSVYLTLYNLLSDDSVTSGQNLKSVLEKINKDSLSADIVKKFDYGRRLMEEEDKAVFLKHKWSIVQSLSVDEVLPELISCGVVSPKDRTDIKYVKYRSCAVVIILEAGTTYSHQVLSMVESQVRTQKQLSLTHSHCHS